MPGNRHNRPNVGDELWYNKKRFVVTRSGVRDSMGGRDGVEIREVRDGKPSGAAIKTTLSLDPRFQGFVDEVGEVPPSRFPPSFSEAMGRRNAMLYKEVSKVAQDNPETRRHLVPLLSKYAQGYTIGPGGLGKPKRTKIEPNTIHYMGASSDPSLVIVTKVSDDSIEFLDEKGRKRRDQAWIAHDLIARGDATWLKTYASYVAKYENWKKAQPGTKVDPKKFFRDREPVTVLVEAVGAASKFPRGDAWYGAEEYGNVGGREKDDGTFQYEIETHRGPLEKLKKDKRFKIIKEQKGHMPIRGASLRDSLAKLAREIPETRKHVIPLLKI